ncbi:MAG TPA: PEPxxWA-CTERM sorting domain-containing protein [Phenylobacterium sp.]
MFGFTAARSAWRKAGDFLMRIKLSPAVAAAGVALAFAAGLATSAAATTYVGSYTITDNIGNNFLGSQGLVVETLNDLNNPFSFSLTGNNGTTVDLFDIWTNETHLDSDDLVSRGIKVTFTFTQPGHQGGDVNGQTFGVNGTIDNGQVTWNGPLALNFGGTALTITLGNATFNSIHDDTSGLIQCRDCLDAGLDHHADVTATFTQTVKAGVPEPASWALMITGFGMAGATLRRRRATVAA